MPIARLSRTDPATGETVYFEQPYTPGIDPAQQEWLDRLNENRQQQQMMRMAMEAKTAEAAKAVQSAIQFQATRQFLNDIKNGMPREEALARNARMFYSNPEAALKATEPEPAMTPYQQEMIKLSRARLNAPDIRSVGNGGLVQVSPDGTIKELFAPSKTMSPEERLQQELQGREFSAAMKAFQDARKVLLDPDTTPAQAEMAQSELNRAEKTIKRIRSPKPQSVAIAQPGPAPLSSVVEQPAPIAPAPTVTPSKKRYRWDNGKLVEIK